MQLTAAPQPRWADRTQGHSTVQLVDDGVDDGDP